MARSSFGVICCEMTRLSPIVRVLSGDLPTSEITLAGGVSAPVALAPHTLAAWACKQSMKVADQGGPVHGWAVQCGLHFDWSSHVVLLKRFSRSTRALRESTTAPVAHMNRKTRRTKTWKK